MKRHIVALLLALVLAATCCPTGFAEETCLHENTETKVEWGYCKYTPYDSQYHSMTVDEEETVTCKDCGKVLSFKVLRTITQQACERHASDDGCEECGYVTSCAHANLTRVEYEIDDYLEDCVSLGEQGHTGKLVKMYGFICADCGSGYVRDNEEVHTGEIVTWPHSFDGGKCYECGYENTCAHEHQTEQKDESYGYWCPLNEEAYEGHEVTYQCDKVTVCADCGEEIEWDSDETTYTEPHTFENGVCKLCCFVLECDHANACEKEDVEDEVVGSTEDQHTVKRVTRHIRRCDDCGIVLSETQSEPVEVTEAHTFADGLCSVCGAEKPDESTTAPTAAPTTAPTTAPTAAPTTAPTAAPAPAPSAEPVYEDVAAENPVHGVKAEDRLPMVETLSTVAKALESEKIRANIVNVEKLITHEEKAALDQLSLKEQMMTVLCAIGFESQVQEALAAEGTSLSAEAETLKEQILTRISAMDEEETAAFAQILEENFPVETVEVDGVEYRFFVLEVEIETEEGAQSERYGFREEDGAWIFVKLSVANMMK